MPEAAELTRNENDEALAPAAPPRILIIDDEAAIRESLETLLTFEGFLVDIKRDDGWHWNTSLTREDTGAGGCEIVFVESIHDAGH